LRAQPFEEPRLFVVKSEERPLSGPALLELMRAVLDKGVPFRFCARGWSMAPFIRDGDVITVSPLGRGRPRTGDVVAFVRPGMERLVVHRMVARTSAGFFMQGDCLPDQPDGVVPAENLLGRVTRIERKGRQIWLGLGPERCAIAWLSRTRRLRSLGAWLASRLRPLMRR
jgi:hypothetical protein